MGFDLIDDLQINGHPAHLSPRPTIGVELLIVLGIERIMGHTLFQIKEMAAPNLSGRGHS